MSEHGSVAGKVFFINGRQTGRRAALLAELAIASLRGDHVLITGPDWTFALPSGYEMAAIEWRRELPPKIHMRMPAGQLVVYTPKIGSRRANENRIVGAHRQAVGFP
jgi:hypothetical protein